MEVPSMRTSLSAALSLLFFVLLIPLLGHGEQQFGAVNFPVSCSPAAQEQFNRAVAMLHSFFPGTNKAFTTVSEIDPSCAMAYWGVAMSNRVNPLIGPMSSKAVENAVEAIAKGKAIGAKTRRERAYVDAMDAYWRGGTTIDHLARARAYEAAMADLHQRYPDDTEGAIFYALALNEAADPTDTTYTSQIKAGQILEEVFARQPDHPGVAHYLIHTYDYAPLALRGLPAARRYAALAPSSAHALHMPSHVFSMLGYWQDSIASNIAALAASKDYSEKNLGGLVLWTHQWDFMVYAYLQGAQDLHAKQVLDERNTVEPTKVAATNIAYISGFAAIPVRYAIERGQWAEARVLDAPATAYPYVDAITAFGRGLGAARSGDATAARQEADKLQVIRKRLLEAKDTYWAEQTEILRRAVAAWTARDDQAAALRLMRSAADMEDASVKHIAMENRLVPMRELLGELLVEAGQPAAALREFEQSLQNAPNRFRSFHGAAEAAERAGDTAKAWAYYEKLVALCQQADTERPELMKARAFLAQH